MRKPWTLVVLLACTSSLLGACGAREEVTPSPREAAPPPAMSKADAAPAPEEAPSPAPVVVAAVPAESASPSAQAVAPERPPSPVPTKPARTVPKAPAAVPAPIPAEPTAAAAPPQATVPRPAAQATAPAAAQAPARPNGPEIADPGGDVAVSPAKAGLTRVGAEKCELCHKAQYSSWAASAHARRTPPLDCESCHGPGSEYKALAVMKDPAKARAAGLVQPDAAYCGKCHKGKWDPALLGKAHAHKAAS